MSDISEEIGLTPENLTDEKFVIFSLMEKQYAIPSQFIGEIALFDTVYPLPLLPPYVLGVINRYSIPYALFDIGLLLFKTSGLRNKVLVMKDSLDRIAFLIDEVTSISDIPKSSLIEIERSTDKRDISDLILYSFNWNKKDVFVLDIHRILDKASAEVD